MIANEAILLAVHDGATGETLLEVEVKGHEKIYRDRAYKMFVAVLAEFYALINDADKANVYELVYRGWLELHGRDVRNFALGPYNVSILR